MIYKAYPHWINSLKSRFARAQMKLVTTEGGQISENLTTWYMNDPLLHVA